MKKTIAATGSAKSAQRINPKKIQPFKNTAPTNPIKRLLSFSSILTTRFEKAERRKSTTQTQQSNSVSLKNGSAFEFIDSTNSFAINHRLNRGESFGNLREIETKRRKKRRFTLKCSKICTCLTILSIALLGIAIAIIITTITSKTKTTATTLITQTTTSQTTSTETTATTSTTTTTTSTTSTTTTSSTTTSTATTMIPPVICPSSEWHPNGTTVAGSPTGGSGSTPSKLSAPFDVRVDSALNVYVADYSNYRFMKWAPGSTNGTIFGPLLGAGGSSDTNHMNTATTLTFDSTEIIVYMSDTFNCRILKMNLITSNITVAVGSGCGSALNQFSQCNGLHVDRFGNLYVSDWSNNRVLKFNADFNSSTNGIIVAGTGSAGSSLNQLSTPWNIFVDESDSDALYVADYNNHRVVKWYPNATNGIIVAGGNGAGSLYTQLNNPKAVYVDSFQTVYVVDCNNHRIMKWLRNATNGTLVAGVSTSPGPSEIQLNQPSGLYFDRNGDLYVCDYVNNRVQRFTINNTSC